jgi:mannitol-1-/sugar-/sorbitol-6-phosphatase
VLASAALRVRHPGCGGLACAQQVEHIRNVMRQRYGVVVPYVVAAPGRCLLFDVDGVLLDGQDVYLANWSAWARKHGLDPGAITVAMHGRRPEETIAELAPHLDVGRERAALAADLARFPPVPAMPGSAELLGDLGAGRWAIVTSSRKDHIRRCFEAAGLPIPPVAIFGDDVEHGKPAPDGYLRAAAALGAAPALCAVIEDSPAGVQSGKAAGCLVIAVATTHAADDLRAADKVLPSLRVAAPLLRTLAGLPPQ